MTAKKHPVEKSTHRKPKKQKAGLNDQQSGSSTPDIGTSAGTWDSSVSEESYRLMEVILRSASDGILAVNRENEVLFANERFVEMWRIPQELMDKRDDNLLLQNVLNQLSNPQDFLQKVQDLYNSSEESFDTLSFKDGRVFDRLSRPMLQGKELLGRVWSFRDITARKRVEEALDKERYEMQLLMNSLPNQIYFKDRASRFTRISKSQADLFNLSDPAQAIGKTDFDFFTEEHARPAFEDEQVILQTGQPLTREERETWANRPDRWVSTTKMPIRDAEGKIVGTFGISTDITERIQAEEELRRATDELASLNVKLQQSLEHENLLACTDGLTGLCNHRYLFELAGREFHAAVRYKRSLAFLMFDIDYFKQVNDTLGHAGGNRLLVTVAQTTVAHVRASDLVARYGGDEFIVILPDTSAQQALPVAERIRASVASMRVGTDQQEPLAVTLSMGIADLRREPMDENVEQIIQRADEALYQAKHNGRNRVVILGAG